MDKIKNLLSRMPGEIKVILCKIKELITEVLKVAKDCSIQLFNDVQNCICNILKKIDRLSSDR